LLAGRRRCEGERQRRNESWRDVNTLRNITKPSSRLLQLRERGGMAVSLLYEAARGSRPARGGIAAQQEAARAATAVARSLEPEHRS
jgi:hypothetical protein